MWYLDTYLGMLEDMDHVSMAVITRSSQPPHFWFNWIKKTDTTLIVSNMQMFKFVRDRATITQPVGCGTLAQVSDLLHSLFTCLPMSIHVVEDGQILPRHHKP